MKDIAVLTSLVFLIGVSAADAAEPLRQNTNVSDIKTARGNLALILESGKKDLGCCEYDKAQAKFDQILNLTDIGSQSVTSDLDLLRFQLLARTFKALSATKSNHYDSALTIEDRE